MPYPPISVNIRAICGRLFSARSFCEFRAFCGNIFSPTDFTDLHRYLWCAVLPQNSQNTQNLVAWVWQGCHTLLICAHLCHLWEALLCQKFPCIPCVLWESLSSHGWHGLTQIVRCAVLPQNSRNWAAWVWQGCHTLLICEHPCSSVGGSSLPEGSVRSVRSVGEHRSLVGALETSAPPTE